MSAHHIQSDLRNQGHCWCPGPFIQVWLRPQTHSTGAFLLSAQLEEELKTRVWSKQAAGLSGS